jgi:hypothetical protein
VKISSRSLIRPQLNVAEFSSAHQPDLAVIRRQGVILVGGRQRTAVQRSALHQIRTAVRNGFRSAAAPPRPGVGQRPLAVTVHECSLTRCSSPSLSIPHRLRCGTRYVGKPATLPPGIGLPINSPGQKNNCL